MTKILLVEDDDALRDMLHLTLEKMGHAVIDARNGKEATACQEQTPVDVMLTDLVMPEKEGLETILEFRRRWPEVKIIAMSGGSGISRVDYLRIAKPMGAVAALAKPFSNEELAAALAIAAPRS
jgi:DNA-binding response OmpR family regulator